MPTPSPRLQMNIFATSDQFNTSQFDANFSILDNYPGHFICLSSSRPVWGAAQNGMRITETDTGLSWYWNATIPAFVRQGGTGLLGRQTQTASIGTTTTWTPPGTGSLTSAVSLTVHPPNGGRQLMIVVEVPEITNAKGLTYLVIQRDAVILNSYPVWTTQETGSGNSSNAGSKGDFITFDVPNEATAVYTLYFAVATVVAPSTATLVAAPTRPISLTVVEV